MFSAQEGPKGSKMEVQKASKIKLFLESNKTTESCSRLHAELVFKVWRSLKPHVFRDHFRKPSSCCTGTVVSQIFAENDTPESVQNLRKSFLKWSKKQDEKNNVKSGGGPPRRRRGEGLRRPLWQCGNIAFCSAGGGYSLGFATFQHFQRGCTPYKLVTKVTSVEASD